MLDGGSAAVLATTIAKDEADRAYFLARAEAELELAQASMDPDAVHCHYELAGLYLDLTYNGDAFADWKLNRSVAEAQRETVEAPVPQSTSA
jgi:hypothetical protein